MKFFTIASILILASAELASALTITCVGSIPFIKSSAERHEYCRSKKACRDRAKKEGVSENYIRGLHWLRGEGYECAVIVPPSKNQN